MGRSCLCYFMNGYLNVNEMKGRRLGPQRVATNNYKAALSRFSWSPGSDK